MSDDRNSRSETLLSLLANPRRRASIWTLAAIGSCDLETLAQFVVAIEGRDPKAANNAEPVRRMRNNFRNRHLDQLEAANVIERTNDVIAPGPQFTTALQTLVVSRDP